MGIALDLQFNCHSGHQPALCNLPRKRHLQRCSGIVTWLELVDFTLIVYMVSGFLGLIAILGALCTNYMEQFSTGFCRYSPLHYNIQKASYQLWKDCPCINLMCQVWHTTSKHRPRVPCASLATKILLEAVSKLTPLKEHQVPHPMWLDCGSHTHCNVFMCSIPQFRFLLSF